jgi:lysozyme
MTDLTELPKDEQNAIEASRIAKAQKGILNLNQYGEELIKSYEKLKLKSYRDSGGVWTIGYGQTTNKFIKVVEGMQITEDRAKELFNQHLADITIPLLNSELYYENQLNDFQYSALASLVYNSGSMKVKRNGKFSESRLMQHLNNNLVTLASIDIQSHDIRNRYGDTLLGLKRRRMCEYYLFTQYKTDEYEPKEWVQFIRSKTYNEIKRVQHPLYTSLLNK